MFIGIQVYLMDRKNHINRIFALLCLSVVCWAFVTAQLYYSIDTESAHFWLFCVSFWPLPSSLLLHFALAFTRYDRYLGKAALAVLVYLPSIALIGIIQYEGGYIVDAIASGGWSYMNPSEYTKVLEPIVLMGMNAVGIALCLIYYLRQADGVRKKQAWLVLIGLSIPMLADVISFGLSKTMDIMLPKLSILGFVIGTGGFTGYASLKYKLFDITPATAADNIIATMPDALLLIDANGDVLTINDSTLKMLGYDRRDLIGRPVIELFKPIQVLRIPSSQAALGRISETWKCTSLPVRITGSPSRYRQRPSTTPRAPSSVTCLSPVISPGEKRRKTI
jgi:PAS domain-containing protein